MAIEFIIAPVESRRQQSPEPINKPHIYRSLKMKYCLVEDSIEIRKRLRAMIMNIDREAEIFEAQSPAAAIVEILEKEPEVVVLDLRLNGGTGLDVLRAIHPALPDTSVIVLSNNSGEPYRRKCAQLGAKWFIDKALQLPSMETVLKDLYGKLRGDLPNNGRDHI